MQVNGRDLRDQGIASLQQALAADPNNEKAETDLGSAFLMNDDLLHAEPYLEKAVAGGSSDPMPHYYYALLLQLQFQSGTPKPEQLERQEKELEQAIKLDPSLAAAYNLLSTNERERKDFDAAIRASLRAVTLNPREQTYALNLANASLGAQRIPEAQALIERLRDSTNPRVLSQLASMQAYITQWNTEHQHGQDRSQTGAQNVLVQPAPRQTPPK